MNKTLKIGLISLLAVAVVGGVTAPEPANATMTVGALTISSSGTLRVDGATGSAIDIGDASQTGTISVGASGGAMTLNLATGNSIKTTNIGTGNVVDTINIGTGGGNDIIAIGTAAGSSSLTLLSGSGDMTFDSEGAYLFTLAAASEIDVTVAVSTVTSGVIDMNVTAGNAAVSAIDLALTQNTGAAAGVDVIGLNMLLTQSDDDGDMFGIKIVAADGAAVAGSYEAAITIDNADTSTAGSMPDAIIITSSGINTGVTDAIDASADNITNAINVGINTILGTTAVIDFTDLDVDADGLMVFASDGAGDQITIAAPAADFQAMVVDATTAVSTQTAGMIDLNVKTITSTAVGGVALALAVNDAASGITVYGNKTDVTVDTDAGHGHTVYGEYIGITANDADSTIYGLAIQAEDAATQLVTAGLLINNAQSSAINMTDGIKITAGNANNIVDAIDASDAEITNAINIGVNAIVGTQFAVAHTTGAVTLTQQAVSTIPLLITGLDDGDAAHIDINTHNVGGSIIDIDWTTETQTADVAGIDVDMSNLTADATNNVYGIHVNDHVGNTGSTEYGIFVEGTNWDYGLNVADVSLFAGVATFTGGIDVDGDLDIDFDAVGEEINITQSLATGAANVPLIMIDDDRTGTNANVVAEATLMIDPEGTHAINVVDGITYLGGALEANVLSAEAVSASSLVVTSAHYGRTVFFTYAGAVTVTLPAAGEPIGSWFRCVNANTDTTAPTYATPVADNLVTFNNASADSVTFGAGHRIGSSVLFISNGSFWVAMNENGSCTMTVTDP